jgi:hypothetical protein
VQAPQLSRQSPVRKSKAEGEQTTLACNKIPVSSKPTIYLVHQSVRANTCGFPLVDYFHVCESSTFQVGQRTARPMVDDVSLYSRLYQKTCVVQTKNPISPERQRPLLQIYMTFCSSIDFFPRDLCFSRESRARRAQSRWPTTSASPVHPHFRIIFQQIICVSPIPYLLSQGSSYLQEKLSERVFS